MAIYFTSVVQRISDSTYIVFFLNQQLKLQQVFGLQSCELAVNKIIVMRSLNKVLNKAKQSSCEFLIGVQDNAAFVQRNEIRARITRISLNFDANRETRKRKRDIKSASRLNPYSVTRLLARNPRYIKRFSQNETKVHVF